VPFCEVDGLNIHYVDVGPPGVAAPDAGPAEAALVLVHAFPLHSAMWAPQLSCLSSRRRVVAPDLPGFGGSDAPEELSRYTMGGYADTLAGLLDRLGLERVVAGGLSLGGYVCLAFLRQYPDRLAALVLADTRAAADTPEVVQRRTDQQDQVARRGTAAVIDALLAGLLCDRTKQDRPALVEQVRRLMDNPTAGYIGALEAMKHRVDATDELASISVPTLVVVGEDDTLSPPEVARAMHDRISGSTLAVLPRAAHLSNLEAPDEFNAAVEELLDRL
jgi:pimeloyl-ACP methyl ester carboxylesterase